MASDPGRSAGLRYVRLTREFLERFRAAQEFPTVREFTDWARHGTPPRRVAERSYMRLCKGDPAPEETARLFAEYISDRLVLGRHYLRSIAEPCAPPPRGRGAPPFKPPDVDRHGWGVLTLILRGLLAFNEDLRAIPDEAFCDDDEDFDEAATITERCVGRMSSGKDGPRLPDDRAQVIGREVMRKEKGEYAAWLSTCWQVNPRTVMFSTLRQGQGYRRVGVNVILAVSDQAYSGLRSGGLSHAALAREHMCYQSDKLHINAYAFVRLSGLRDQVRRKFAQAHMGAYQMAMLAPPLGRREMSPSFIAFAAVPENEQRLLTNGFDEPGGGANDPFYGHRALELAPPDPPNSGWGRPLAYNPFVGLLRGYQETFAEDYALVSSSHARPR